MSGPNRYNRRMGKLGGIILLSALALSGCAAASAADPEVNPAIPASYDSTYSADEFFIAGVKLNWQGEKPRNAELAKAGEAYCAGAPIIAGANAAVVAEYAEAVYCPKP